MNALLHAVLIVCLPEAGCGSACTALVMLAQHKILHAFQSMSQMSHDEQQMSSKECPPVSLQPSAYGSQPLRLGPADGVEQLLACDATQTRSAGWRDISVHMHEA